MKSIGWIVIIKTESLKLGRVWTDIFNSKVYKTKEVAKQAVESSPYMFEGEYMLCDFPMKREIDIQEVFIKLQP